MNDSMKEYIHLKKQFQEQDKGSSSEAAHEKRRNLVCSPNTGMHGPVKQRV